MDINETNFLCLEQNEGSTSGSDGNSRTRNGTIIFLVVAVGIGGMISS